MWSVRWRIVLCLVSALYANVLTSNDIPDFRIVSRDDIILDSSTHVFERQGLDDFAEIVIDEFRQQIIVGAKNYLLRLGLPDLRLLELTDWSPANHTIAVCLAKGQKLRDCHNFIRVIIVHQQAVFACGTNAYSPLCSWRQIDQLNNIMTWVTGVAKSPFNQRQNCTHLMTSNGDLYSATVTDFTGRDAAIYRMMGPSKRLRTVQYNSRWLNEPDFISAYEIGDYVYFFFREAAVEYINCGKAIYSRVARICKNDVGGKVLLEDNWTTFVKARLNCSLPGDYPFYFNELQSTYYVEDEQLVYGVFTTSPNSVYASAVCAYNLTAFEQVLSGPFKYQKSSHSAWSRVSNGLPYTCTAAAEQLSVNAQRHLVNVQKYQMMDGAVQPLSERPPVVIERQRFTHIVVDHGVTYQHSLPSKADVVFLATLEGKIYKYVLPNSPSGTTGCLVEVLHVMPDNLPQPIQALKLSSAHGSLVVGTASSVYRISVHRCHKLATRTQCLGLNDPYCGWDPVLLKCAPIGHPHLSLSCSDDDFPVDGGWSEWSSWERCYGDKLAGEQCICRTRSCDRPKPQSGGLPCSGPRIQVLNCTVHGNWSEWSSWSSCSVKEAGLTVRTRQRFCISPVPKHGGRPCVGDSVQTEPCLIPPATLSCHQNNGSATSENGQWSGWTEWTQCSVNCGDGHQTRLRICLTSNHKCDGSDREMRSCSTEKCPVLRKTSSWSSWRQVNALDDGTYIEERLKCICRARTADHDLCSPRLRTTSRQCSARGTDCSRLPATPPSATTTTPCPKCGDTKVIPDERGTSKKENSIFDKDLVLSDESYQQTVRPYPLNRRSVTVNNSSAFCHCRDLGPLRICRRCLVKYTSQALHNGA